MAGRDDPRNTQLLPGEQHREKMRRDLRPEGLASSSEARGAGG